MTKGRLMSNSGSMKMSPTHVFMGVGQNDVGPNVTEWPDKLFKFNNGNCHAYKTPPHNV